jgi:hypothetical protein
MEMLDPNRRKIQLTKRFDEVNQIVSLTIAKEINNSIPEGVKSFNSKDQGKKIVIYVENDSIISIPGIFFHSIEEVIQEIDDSKYVIRDEEGQELLGILFDILVENIRVWSENKYETRYLYYKIAFPLLKKLKEVGETKFQLIFQQEILKSYILGNLEKKEFLDSQGYLKLLGDFF